MADAKEDNNIEMEDGPCHSPPQQEDAEQPMVCAAMNSTRCRLDVPVTLGLCTCSSPPAWQSIYNIFISNIGCVKSCSESVLKAVALHLLHCTAATGVALSVKQSCLYKQQAHPASHDTVYQHCIQCKYLENAASQFFDYQHCIVYK